LLPVAVAEETARLVVAEEAVQVGFFKQQQKYTVE
jgi:hypothetical protein